ncbi:bacteriophage abortive infection AbiH family protein [Flavobacterium sp. LB1P62]|uniref:bacteriophage abortive infection AbiH family protein n=1 Tax=Flavobacterium sp. LB1P62 TaxID=3401715 RepID=UPI003AAD4DF4
MDTLYIIGNGFDLYHGLDTKYQSFGMFLQDKHTELYDCLIEFYGLPYLDQDDEDSYYDPLWADFENALADLDFEYILDENSDYLPNIASDDFRDRDLHSFQQVMEGIVDNLTAKMYEAFKEFILNVKFPNDVKGLQLKIDSDALFLNFNYTDTLERFYNVNDSRILYIHNKATSDETLILGHGTDPSEFKSKEEIQPDGLSDEEIYEWQQQMADNYDYSYDSGKEELLTYFSKSYKSTEEIIQNNQTFFSNLKSIKNIIVLGHSISNVDQPYFKNIIESIEDKTVNWDASYHGEKQPIYENMIAIGLNDEQINLFKMDEIKVKNDINYTLF